jgi:heme/copper-type cytochrome/quinol oxidase subunit 2
MQLWDWNPVYYILQDESPNLWILIFWGIILALITYVPAYFIRKAEADKKGEPMGICWYIIPSIILGFYFLIFSVGYIIPQVIHVRNETIDERRLGGQPFVIA